MQRGLTVLIQSQARFRRCLYESLQDLYCGSVADGMMESRIAFTFGHGGTDWHDIGEKQNNVGGGPTLNSMPNASGSIAWTRSYHKESLHGLGGSLALNCSHQWRCASTANGVNRLGRCLDQGLENIHGGTILNSSVKTYFAAGVGNQAAALASRLTSAAEEKPASSCSLANAIMRAW